MKQEFQASRRDLLKFLAAGGAASAAVADAVAGLPEPASGVVLATPEDVWRVSRPPGRIPGKFASDPQGLHARFEVCPWVFYERIDLREGATLPRALSLFQRCVSTGCPPLVTNMRCGGHLPAPQYFTLQQIYILVDPSSCAEAVADFLGAGTYRYHYTDRIHAEGPCLAVARVGLLGDVAVTFEDFDSKWSSLSSEIGRKHRGSQGEFGVDFSSVGHTTIESQAHFGVDLYLNEHLSGPTKGDAAMWFCLDGILARRVQ